MHLFLAKCPKILESFKGSTRSGQLPSVVAKQVRSPYVDFTFPYVDASAATAAAKAAASAAATAAATAATTAAENERTILREPTQNPKPHSHTCSHARSHARTSCRVFPAVEIFIKLAFP